MRKISICLIAGALFAFSAHPSDLPDTPLAGPEGPGRLDPNRSPLPVLARAPGVGREGARRIGERRAAEPIADAGELGLLLGGPPDLREDLFSFPGARPWSSSVRLRRERTGSGGVRETEVGEFRLGEWEAGVLAERDPAENRIDDFLSWSVLADLRGGKVRIAAGDLAVRLGGGLLVGTSPPFGTPSDFSPYPRSRLSRYRSRMENEAHRGAAARFPLAGGTAYLLLTETARDARVDDEGRVSSLDDAGYHRTELEKNRRDALREGIAAARWERAVGGAAWGVTAAAAGYDPPLGGGDLSRKPDAFLGDRLGAAAADFRLGRGPLLLQAEAGRSDAGGWGGRALFRAAGKGGRFLLRFRNYAGRFHVPRSTAERRIGSEPAGEIGWIVMVDRRLGGARVEARGHRYASFARTWNSEEPVRGEEYALRFEAGRGVLSWRAAAGSASRRETRRGVRVKGGSASLALGAIWRGRSGRRLRADLRWGASRTPGSDRARAGAGLSLLLTLRRGAGGRIDLSWVRLFRGERMLPFPAPSLPGGLPLAWFGGGRSSGGLRASWRGGGGGPLSLSFVLAPEGLSAELVLRRSPPENRR